jgi:predicted amidohydrolase
LARAVGDRLHVALLHIAPRAGDLTFNRRMIENAIVRAGAEGSDWVITPELSVCGYTFEPMIGTDWISVQLGGRGRENQITLNAPTRYYLTN